MPSALKDGADIGQRISGKRKEQTMSRYIDADAFLKEYCEPYPHIYKAMSRAMAEAPSIEIVRCQDCKYWVYHFNGCSRNPCTEPWYATDFCNYGEREGE